MRPPTSYRVHAEVWAGGESTVTAGNQTIPVDSTWAADEPAGTPGPAELLAAAFAACLMKNLERSSALLSFRYEHADIDVRARRQDIPPRFVEIEYELHLVTDEDERRVDLVHRNLRQFGTVYNTLAAVCDVHGSVVIVPTPAYPPAP
ncbi:MAG TPA: OsmC family protein [Cellulomonas sp.]|uniref:OsmC family protein n=1 Tax=Cellulomonas sp. TaxID=40001 RepID=UPI002E35A84F|nr:OsmC family protein [Cellulomonas sp.]HEX5331256.1 OsmC family protein [Cellulomonas sp.]